MSMRLRTLLQETVSSIASPSTAHHAAARAHLDTLTKPLGSLGRLEDLAAQWVGIRQHRFSEPIRKAAYVFAADHGITAEGVSAYPREVTHQMVLNFLAAGAAINVLARLHGAALHVVDVGVDADFESLPGLLHRKVGRGTRNMLHEAAMSEDELHRALGVGIDLADEAAVAGNNLLAIGEMGIGNTTAASAITCVLTNALPEQATGAGTGVNTTARAHKVAIIQAVIERHTGQGANSTPFEILRTMGGFEIAAMAGMVLGAAKNRIAILCDGFISTAAAALAVAMAPHAHGYLIGSHESAEPGHQLLLRYLNLSPLLLFKMRLGEGTGAVLAMPIVESALALYLGMATFESAGVSESSQ
jgi:nicotinate-nucleotide--dimethylbenzimidazole phosphoribosyltransferase